MDLARCILGQADEADRDGIDAKAMRFSELLTMQFRSFGGEGHRALAEVPDRGNQM
jgi:hypothetical protein